MIKKRIILSAFALSAIFGGKAYAQEGSNTYAFLGIPVSAHSAALGGNNISIIEDDITLMYTNPALLTNVSHNTLNFDFTSYIASTNKLSVAYARQAGERTTWAVGAQYLTYGKIDQTDAIGNMMGDFTPSDFALQGTFAYLMSDYWSGAITAKMLYSKYGYYKAFAMAADLGVNYYNEDYGFSMSLVGRSFGGQIDPLYEERESLPYDVAIGFSKDLGHAPVRLNLTFDDITHWKNVNFIQHCIIGADVFIGNNVWLALGYNFRQAHEMKTADGSSHFAGFNVGGGLNIKKFKIALAWGKYHIASSSLVVNASYTLPTIEKKAKKKTTEPKSIESYVIPVAPVNRETEDRYSAPKDSITTEETDIEVNS